MAENTPENTGLEEQAPDAVQAATDAAVATLIETPLTPSVNSNGLTAEEQAEYFDYYTSNNEYHPDQPIPRQDRTFGIVEEENPFLSSEANDGWSEDMVLGQLNLQCEFNHTVPQGTSLSRKEQQRLFGLDEPQ